MYRTGMAVSDFPENELVTVFTTAPQSYDYSYVIEVGSLESGNVRVLDIPAHSVNYQRARYESGLYVTTLDIEVAATWRSTRGDK